MKTESGTDWARVDAMRDEDIDTSDSPVMDRQWFAHAKVHRPSKPVVRVPVDPDVLAWFQSNGSDVEKRMSVALRTYAEGQGMDSQPVGASPTK